MYPSNKYFKYPIFIVFLCIFHQAQGVGQVIYAVNAGGETHTDANGIRYERDPLAGKIGIASDYGKRLLIGRVPPNDHILYQTERYHTSTFGYKIYTRVGCSKNSSKACNNSRKWITKRTAKDKSKEITYQFYLETLTNSAKLVAVPQIENEDTF